MESELPNALSNVIIALTPIEKDNGEVEYKFNAFLRKSQTPKCGNRISTRCGVVAVAVAVSVAVCFKTATSESLFLFIQTFHFSIIVKFFVHRSAS